jgi:integrase
MTWRHYFALLLIAAGLDAKVVQARMRHASAMTTLNTYAHLWLDKDESSRAAIAGILAAREDKSRSEEMAD